MTSVDDLALGSDDLPPTEGLRYRLAPRGRVVVRPSGTEPKLKSYLEVVLPVAPDDDLARLRAQAADLLSAISADLALDHCARSDQGSDRSREYPTMS